MTMILERGLLDNHATVKCLGVGSSQTNQHSDATCATTKLADASLTCARGESTIIFLPPHFLIRFGSVGIEPQSLRLKMRRLGRGAPRGAHGSFNGAGTGGYYYGNRQPTPQQFHHSQPPGTSMDGAYPYRSAEPRAPGTSMDYQTSWPPPPPPPKYHQNSSTKAARYSRDSYFTDDAPTEATFAVQQQEQQRLPVHGNQSRTHRHQFQQQEQQLRYLGQESDWERNAERSRGRRTLSKQSSMNRTQLWDHQE